jgi:amino acid permease
MAFVEGYTVFLPGFWDIPTFFFSYTMIGIMPLLFLYWKIVHRSQVSTLDLLSDVLVDQPRLVEKRARCEFLREGTYGGRPI